MKTSWQNAISRADKYNKNGTPNTHLNVNFSHFYAMCTHDYNEKDDSIYILPKCISGHEKLPRT